MSNLINVISGSCNSCGSNEDVYQITVKGVANFQLCKKCRRELFEKLRGTIVLSEDYLEEYGGKWFPIWKQDKENILEMMHRNLAADLDAGYNFTGQLIQKQLSEIARYTEEFDRQITQFASMSDKDVSRWCYYDLKKRGAID